MYIGALSPERLAYVPLTLDILHNSIILFLFVLRLCLHFISLFLVFISFHIGRDVTICVTCYYDMRDILLRH